QATQQEATKFEVKIRIQERELFRPGMSVTAEIETRYRTNVLAVPIQCVTTRVPGAYDPKKKKESKPPPEDDEIEGVKVEKKKTQTVQKAVEVVFGIRDDKATLTKVKRGISDNTHVEI